MRLLELNDDGSVSISEFHGSEIPCYAILSHTWGPDSSEVTFQDIISRSGLDKVGYKKLRFCGEQAKRDGIRYFWIDTCAIDKSSSTELTEAINSMFRWYLKAEKCYVYLSDVSVPKDYAAEVDISSELWQADFKKSRWFTRGWTLQELLAPRSIEFFSQEHQKLGDRNSLQGQISLATGIPISALQGEPLSQFTVDDRLSWMSRRTTKREEDRAYSLLGIFNVHMPLIYGEGEENSFRRLYKKIKSAMKPQHQEMPIGAYPDSSGSAEPNTSRNELPIVSKPIHAGISQSSKQTTSEYNPQNMSIELARLDIDEVIDSQDHWQYFRLAPLPNYSCSRTHHLHVGKLEDKLKSYDGLKESWNSEWQETQPSHDCLGVAPLTSQSVHTILTSIDILLRRYHELNGSSGNKSGQSRLPPEKELVYLLQRYNSTIERFYPTFAQERLDINELLMLPDIESSTAAAIVLAMIASGCISVPSIEARWLTGGLTELCTMFLWDKGRMRNWLTSKYNLHLALLWTITAVWSGDKFHMDTALNQGARYIDMVCDFRASTDRPTTNDSFSPEDTLSTAWQKWLSIEKRRRMIYSWFLVDQEVALLFDKLLSFCSFADFLTPMPEPDDLWHCKSDSEWSDRIEQHYGVLGLNFDPLRQYPLSLMELFSCLSSRYHEMEDLKMTALNLRLLLTPLLILVCQTSFAAGLPDPVGPRVQYSARVAEVLSYLNRWHDLATAFSSRNSHCATTQASFVLFHLISLNNIVYLPWIEDLVRSHYFNGSLEALKRSSRGNIEKVQDAIYHSGQVFRLIRGMSIHSLPPWWSVAVYRASLVLWICSLESSTSHNSGSTSFVAVDMVLEDSLLNGYLRENKGVPVLTGQDGNCIEIDPSSVSKYCLQAIDSGISNRLSDGIRGKLQILAKFS